MAAQPFTRRDFQRPWVTDVKKVLSGGRFVGADGSMWLLRKVPLVPVVDARDKRKAYDAGIPIMRLEEKLAGMAMTTGSRRALSKGSYREVQYLLINVPDRFHAPHGSPIEDVLNESFGPLNVQRRLLVAAVRLIPKMTKKGENPISASLRSIVHTLTESGVPLEDFEEDYERVSQMMEDSGLRELGFDAFGRSEVNLARFWYNLGNPADVPLLVHPDHLHFYFTPTAAQKAAILQERADENKRIPDCTNWDVEDTFTLTMATVNDLDLPWVDFDNPVANWMTTLLDHNARAVSVRARIEPPKVTRGELRRKRDTYKKEIEERRIQANTEDAEQVEKMQVLSQIEELYATGGGWPTMMDTSIIVAFDGHVKDVSRYLGQSGDAIEVASLLDRQPAAFNETAICSPVRAAPHLQDLPAPTFALSGVVNLSTAGDKDGALLGLTEFDRQPSYISPISASTGDAAPFFAVFGATGSGKTMTLMHLARQWRKWPTRRLGEMTPVVMVDPKAGQDFSTPVRNMGGQVFSLDSLVDADGALDPIRVMADKAEAVQTASAMLSSINPWGAGRRQEFEVPLLSALEYGVRNGGTCIVDALEIANRASPLPDGLLQPIIDLAEATPMSRAIIGVKPGGTPLRQTEGLTLIMTGRSSIPLPSSGVSWEHTPLIQRVGTWVLRMMVYGAASSVSYREGVVILDEAWQFMVGPDGAAEIQRLARLARSMQFLMVLASQRASDFVDNHLTGGISRGLILPLPGGTGATDEHGNVDRGEAGKALDLFQIDATNKYLSRLAKPATMEGSDNPNFYSMRALRDPNTDQIIRGTIGVHVDLSGRAVGVEITIPSWFLKEISTRSSDVIEREKRAQLAPAHHVGELTSA